MSWRISLSQKLGNDIAHGIFGDFFENQSLAQSPCMGGIRGGRYGSFSFQPPVLGEMDQAKIKRPDFFQNSRSRSQGKWSFLSLKSSLQVGNMAVRLFLCKETGTQIFSLGPCFLFMASPTGFEPVLPA